MRFCSNKVISAIFRFKLAPMGAAAAAARSGEFRTGEQESARIGRGRRFFTGCIAILMAETEPLMQAYYSHVKRRGPPQ